MRQGDQPWRSLGLWILIAATSLGCATTYVNIDPIIKDFISAEEAQRYEAIYPLFSNTRKHQLHQLHSVRDVTDYVAFRRNSEAHWFDFKEVKRTEHKKRFNVNMVVTIEENGESDRTPIVMTLVHEQNEWRIDSINY